MRADVALKLHAEERKALRALDADERAAVLDELLVAVREDLEWVLARAAAPDEPAARPPTPPRPASPPPLPRLARARR